MRAYERGPDDPFCGSAVHLCAAIRLAAPPCNLHIHASFIRTHTDRLPLLSAHRHIVALTSANSVNTSSQRGSILPASNFCFVSFSPARSVSAPAHVVLRSTQIQPCSEAISSLTSFSLTLKTPPPPRLASAQTLAIRCRISKLSVCSFGWRPAPLLCPRGTCSPRQLTWMCLTARGCETDTDRVSCFGYVTEHQFFPTLKQDGRCTDTQ